MNWLSFVGYFMVCIGLGLYIVGDLSKREKDLAIVETKYLNAINEKIRNTKPTMEFIDDNTFYIRLNGHEWRFSTRTPITDISTSKSEWSNKED